MLGPSSWGAKAPNLAVLIYIIFASLWLIMAGLGLAGVQLADGALTRSAIQGALALLSVIPLAARLKAAPVIAAVLGVAICLAPWLLSGWRLPLPGPTTAGRGSSREQVEKRLAEQLAQPLPLRPEWARLSTLTLHNLEHYPEAPQVVAEAEQRAQTILTWLRDHASDTLAIRLELRRQGKGPDPNRQSVREFEAAVSDGVQKPASSWQAFSKEVLSRAQARGLTVQAAPLPEEARRQATEFALAWLREHPKSMDAIMSGGPSYTGDPIDPNSRQQALPDPEQEWRSQKGFSGSIMAFWIVLLGVGAAWVGREHFVRPFETAQLPAWTWEGLKRLLRQDGTAGYRIAAGLVTMAASMGLLVVMALLGLPPRKVFAVGLMAGAGLIYSGLSLSEEETAPPSTREVGADTEG